MKPLKVSDIKAKKAELGKEFGIDSSTMDCIVELMQKGKISKPEKLFKDCAPKLDVKGPKSFMYINMGQKSYFFMGSTFPLGAEIAAHLKQVKKEIAKAKEKQKEYYRTKEFFLQELQKIEGKIKGSATGVLKFSKTEGKTCFMEVRPGVKVNGKVKKASLPKDIKEIGYALASKSGQLMEFLPVKEEKETKEKEGLTNKEEAPKDKPTAQGNVDEKALAEKKAKRAAAIKKMKENVGKLQKAIGKVEAGKILSNLEKYDNMLNKLINEAKEDNVIDDAEQAEIDELTDAINELKKQVLDLNSDKKKMTPERRAKIKQNMAKISAKLERITKRLGLA